MALSAARLFASSLSRRIRVVSLPRGTSLLRPAVTLQCQRRGIFGFGKSAPPTETSREDAQARAKAVTEMLMQKEEWRKLASNPGALVAVQNLLAVLSKKGIDVGSGQTPKFADMMKLTADSEFRDAVAVVKAEMKNAGIDLDNPELVKSLMSLSTPKP